MKTKELIQIGVPNYLASKVVRLAGRMVSRKVPKEKVLQEVEKVFQNPQKYKSDKVWGKIVLQIRDEVLFESRKEKASYKVWGSQIDSNTLDQMNTAMELPVTHRGALMPDAHLGYGLPIGGVLAVENAVIPYAVGMDIACRMRLSIFDVSPSVLDGKTKDLEKSLEKETRFGKGAAFQRSGRRKHKIMDDNWNELQITKEIKDTAWEQLGTTGSGNHFVEFGVVEIPENDKGFPVGVFLGLLSHGGSRGPGSKVAKHYSDLAIESHPELPSHLKNLAWLDMSSELGIEYWKAMNLMGRYAEANHEIIHKGIAKRLGYEEIKVVENHHNFAWKEQHDGKDLIVHRKGATPAGLGVLGVIPGSMASPAFIVEGAGVSESLCSASHGAGRKMSRRKAKESFHWNDVSKLLKKAKVKLLSGGIDENPRAYKNIEKVMKEQEDLVRVIGKFYPRLVKMAPEK
jgi:tRNA-splicing ligase RtcB